MTKQQALDTLRSMDHGFIGEEKCKEIGDAFGFEVRTYLAKANPQDFKGLTLWDKDGKPLDQAEGQDAHKVAMQVCKHLGLEYQDCFGIGSQLRACCEAIAKVI